MAEEDIDDDLLYFARVNDIDEVRRLIKAGANANYKEPHGKSMPLHYASANGHEEVVKILVESGSEYAANGGGNTPLHWACQNKKTSVAKILLDSYPKADVLAKNAHGKSILTYAFKAEDAEMVRLILSHPSAAVLEQSRTEARARKAAVSKTKVASAPTKAAAIKGVKADASATPGVPVLPCATVAADSAADNTTAPSPPAVDLPLAAASVTHQLVFKSKRRSKATKGLSKSVSDDLIVRIRELPIMDKMVFNAKAADAAEDSTGLALWPAAIVLSRWIADLSRGTRSSLFRGQRVCELGAGCGLPGITARVYGGAKEVELTDYYGETVRNLAHNAAINSSGSSGDAAITTRAVDWAENWATSRFDIVVGADLVYAAEAVPLLLRTVAGCLKRGGHFLYVCPDERDGLVQFIEGADAAGLQLTVCKEAPQAYYKNPLHKGSDKQAEMFFPGLLSRSQPFRLYDFVAVEAEA